MRMVRLGRVPFQETLRLQDGLLERCRATGEETILLLEHEPVYTIGRTPDQSSLRHPNALPYPVFVTNRGGQATFHGPGQLVVYPILDLRRRRRDLHAYLRALESFLIDLLREFGVEGIRVQGKTGVWVAERKIASIGVGVRKWISMHGVALNVASDLSGFSYITPCGLSGVSMTSLSLETKREIEVGQVIEAAIPRLEIHLRASPAETEEVHSSPLR